jgi:prophage antirepressor-like protein
MDELSLFFEEKQIRTVFSKEEGFYYFVMLDVIEVLTESARPSDYWYRLKKREKAQSGTDLSTHCRQLKVAGKDGKQYMMDCAAREGLFRIIQSIPSPKAEPFKQWLSETAVNYIDERKNKRIQAYRKLKETQEKFFERLEANGIDEKAFVRILNKGDEVLFNGIDIREKYGLKTEEDIDHFISVVLLKGKDFATSITDFNVISKELQDELSIGEEHAESNLDVRKTLLKHGIVPEKLSKEKDIRVLKGKEERKNISKK